MTHQNTMVIHWHFLFGLGDNCSFCEVQSHGAEKQQASSRSLLAMYGELSSSIKSELVPLHRMHTPTCTVNEIMLRDE
jgi:hypothetical protein